MKNSVTTTKNMTSGPIMGQLILFALPLMLGNVFQMLYNTVDSIIVGNFVRQNVGAGDDHRADRGTVASIGLISVITGVIIAILMIFAPQAVRMFSPDEAVIAYGVMFMRVNTPFLLFNGVNHTLAGALRGRGDSKGPMAAMLSTFVGVRQIYLFIVTRFVSNTPLPVGLGYPVGWCCCFVVELAYYFVKRRRRLKRM